MCYGPGFLAPGRGFPPEAAAGFLLTGMDRLHSGKEVALEGLAPLCVSLRVELHTDELGAENFLPLSMCSHYGRTL